MSAEYGPWRVQPGPFASVYLVARTQHGRDAKHRPTSRQVYALDPEDETEPRRFKTRNLAQAWCDAENAKGGEDE